MSDELKTKTARGFWISKFKDFNGETCSIQCSSAIDIESEGSMENPGSSLLWLGPDDANPLILASQAKQFGINTNETTGWVKFPVPDDVLMTTRMHLNRPQVKKLIDVLSNWLETGEL